MPSLPTLRVGRIDGLRPDDLDLAATLVSGQAFRWKRGEDGFWRGMVGAVRVGLRQPQPGDSLEFATDAAGDVGDADEGERFVRRFLRLDDFDLPAHATDWASRDPLFAEAWRQRPGVRILRQDPEECFFAFLCASVAPIPRIGAMQQAVAAAFGTDWGDGYAAFPSATELAEKATEERLRVLGLGFRARRVWEAARALSELPPDHLAALRGQATHAEAKRELRAFFGVGEKIADCICLFALDKDGAIPVDTHIWRIARMHYAPDLAGKSLTEANYARATQSFHDRFGPWAGWAQQTLFYRAAVGSKDRAKSPGPSDRPFRAGQCGGEIIAP